MRCSTSGETRPLANLPRYAPEIHGQSGLDGVDLPDPTVPLSPLHAVDFIIEASHSTTTSGSSPPGR